MSTVEDQATICKLRITAYSLQLNGQGVPNHKYLLGSKEPRKGLQIMLSMWILSNVSPCIMNKNERARIKCKFKEAY